MRLLVKWRFIKYLPSGWVTLATSSRLLLVHLGFPGFGGTCFRRPTYRTWQSSKTAEERCMERSFVMSILMSILRRWSLVLVSLSTTCVFAAEPAPVATLVENGHFKQARPIVEKALSANPKDASALVLMAKIKMAFFDNDAA